MSRPCLRSQQPLVLFATLAAVLLGCRANRSSSDPKFDWDNNLTPITLPEGGKDRDFVQLDGNFCKGLDPGTCFTLLIRIPREDLIQDLGLSMLAVGAESRSFRAKMEEACQSAWTDYRQKYAAATLRPLRHQLVTGVKKMRCVYLFMGQEVAEENTKLADNEIALSVRLTKFDINAQTKGAQIRGIGLNLTSINARTDYRSAFIYSGQSVQPALAGWQVAEGLGIKPISLTSRLDRDVNWSFDLAALKENLDLITKTEAGADDKVNAFVGQAKTALTAVSNLETPVQSSVALITIGYNAFRGLCGEDSSKCKVTSSEEARTQGMKDDLSDLIPSSETNELLRMAMVRSIQGILDSVLTDTKADQIRTKFNLKP